MEPEKRDKRDNILRANPVGTATIASSSSLDVVLQYGLSAKGLENPLLNALLLHPTYQTLPSAVALGLPALAAGG
ncbi:hypothetical protein CJF30_00004960 [Rutstroemia sp. NJR-2017a BBW]|nr:hypothetical protein CJF30_00004960 [Rutstroemia sp. NJR-2017a BBW]